jgi:transcriptional regulator with XRE-family HTH domain
MVPKLVLPPATAAELLRRWVRASEKKHAAIAADLEITPGHLSNIQNGEDTPSAELKRRIEKMTRGAVLALAWEPILQSSPQAEPAESKGNAA